jgi:hypothetical protein
VRRIDETLVVQFLDDDLPHCTCGWPTRGDRRDARAALGHLLVVLRTIGVTAPRTVRATPVDEELCRFDEYMERLRGLAPKTRGAALRIVRELLGQRFHDRPVVFSALEPEQARFRVARLTERCHASVSMGAVVSALHGYFCFRAACGDAVHALIGVYHAHISGKMTSHQNIGASGINSKGDCVIDSFSDKNPNTMP